MRILLINPPWLRFFGGSTNRPHLSLSHIASYVASMTDHEVDLYDADFDEKKIENRLWPISFFSGHENYVKRVNDADDVIWMEIAQAIEDFLPDVVGISSMTATYASTLQIAKVTKRVAPRCRVVLGGKHPSETSELVLENRDVDYVVIGEGEETIVELLDNLDSPEKVRGIAFRENDKIVRNVARNFIKKLDELPIPVFDSKITVYPFEKHPSPNQVWTMIGARGCPFKCTYCAAERKVRARSFEHITKEIKYVREKYGITWFDFVDDSFSFNAKRVQDACNYLEPLDVSWTCNTRVDLLDESIVKSMKNAGCKSIAVGIESASPTTLKKIRKKINLEQMDAGVRLLQKNGIDVHGYFIIGFEWETSSDMFATYEYAKKLKLNECEINVATPLPGTELYNDLIASGKLVPSDVDWSRFHQGSSDMNFSDVPDKEWAQTIFSILTKVTNYGKSRLWLRRLEYFVSPKDLVSRILYRLRKVMSR